MSSASTSAWRQAHYYTTQAEPILANEVVMANPHSHSFHADRNFIDFVDAGRFSGTAGVIDGTPVRTFTNVLDTTYYATARLPKGLISVLPAQDAAMYIIVPAGFTGTVLAGLSVGFFSDNVPIAASVPGLISTLLPVAAGDIVGRFLPATALLQPVAGDEFMRLTCRRDASSVLDNFESDLYLVGVYLLWSTDE